MLPYRWTMPFSSNGFSSRTKVDDTRVHSSSPGVSSSEFHRKGLKASLASAENVLEAFSSITLEAIKQEQSENRELRRLVEELLNKLDFIAKDKGCDKRW